MLRIFLTALITLCLFASNAMAESKNYSVASDGTWPPMEYLDDKKNVIGYSSDYIRAVAKEAGITVDIRNAAWDGIFAGIAAGNYDIVASSVTITPERQKQFLFTDPYCEVRQSVIMPVGKSIKSLADLKGKNVAGQIGTTGIFVLEKANTGANIREYEDIGLAMQDMANGRVDAVICDGPVASYYANKKKDFENAFHVTLTTGEPEFYGFTLKKGNDELAKLLNAGIAKVKEKGIEKELLMKWMGAE